MSSDVVTLATLIKRAFFFLPLATDKKLSAPLIGVSNLPLIFFGMCVCVCVEPLADTPKKTKAFLVLNVSLLENASRGGTRNGKKISSGTQEKENRVRREQNPRDTENFLSVSRVRKRSPGMPDGSVGRGKRMLRFRMGSRFGFGGRRGVVFRRRGLGPRSGSFLVFLLLLLFLFFSGQISAFACRPFGHLGF